MLVVSGGRIAALRSADGALRLGVLDAPGGGLGAPLQTGVTTLDGTEREPQARGLVYAVATGADRGIFKQMLP